MEEKYFACFIDASALMEMFNGENKGKSADLLKKLKQLNDEGAEVKVVTSSANFLRAIWLAKPDAKINDIQKVLSFLDVRFSTADFKNGDAVLNETLEIVKLMGRKKIEYGRKK